MISPPRLVPSVESITPDRESTTRRQSRRIKTCAVTCPLSLASSAYKVARILFFERRYDEPIEQCLKMLEKGPESSGDAPLRGKGFTRRSGSTTEPSLSCIPNHSRPRLRPERVQRTKSSPRRHSSIHRVELTRRCNFYSEIFERTL